MLAFTVISTRFLTRISLKTQILQQFPRTPASIPLFCHWHQSGATMHPDSHPGSKRANGVSAAQALNTDTMPYANCRTQIIDLAPLDLPEDPTTSDSTLREIYQQFVKNCRSHSSQNLTALDTRSRSSASMNGSKTDPTDNEQHAENLAAAILSLKSGIAPPVAFPTETVYGLGADATNPASIAGIFAAKGRPSDNPLIVHVSSTEHLERCLGGTETEPAIPEIYRDLVKEFWPGPLTILIPVPEEGKGVKFAPNVHPGQETIGFRIPSSPHARFLMAVTDRPIAAPSANSSGKPSPTTAQHVKDDLDGKINFILDGGNCHVGVESTVVDGLGEIPLILRPGGLSKSALQKWGKERGNIWQYIENGWEKKKTGIKRKRKTQQEIQGTITKVQRMANGVNGAINGHTHNAIGNGNDGHEDSDLSAAPRAPGMKYKHYAPQGRMFLFETFTPSDSEPNLNPVHSKLKEILSAQSIASETKFARNGKATPAKTSNGTTPNAMQTFIVGILTSTSWPIYAGLDQAENVVPQANQNLLEGSHTDLHGSKDNKAYSNNITLSIAIPGSESAKDGQEYHVRLETIHLGKSSTTISRNLFAALRTCDDLKCDFIFAEAPSRAIVQSAQGNGAEDLEDFETVLERMRKAASEVVET